MSGHPKILDITKEPRQLEALGSKMRAVGLLTAVAFLVLAGVTGLDSKIDAGTFYYCYLIGCAFLLAITLGALFFVLVHHATGAGWGIVVRRLAESVAMMTPFVGLLMIPIFLPGGFNVLYHAWENAEGNPLVEAKEAYLTYPWFLGQMITFFVIWTALAWFFHRTSVKQDQTGDPALSRKMRNVSYPGIILFAFSICLAAFNLLMALDPTWFSTIFGLYYFAGAAMSFFAFLALLMMFLQKNGRLTQAITAEHYHDVGKLCYVFIVFWAYIAFSQYMLIWYANMPEETHWYGLSHDTAGHPEWTALSWLLVVGHFFVPFLCMMSRHVKRNPRFLGIGCVWVVLMQWLDMFWIVAQRINWDGAEPSLLLLMAASLTTTLCLLGVFFFVLSFVLGRNSLVPEKDPRLAESLVFENF